MKIYVASSWRNKHQPQVVALLRYFGHEVYDFRNPPGRTGFAWESIDPAWQNWTVEQYRAALNHPIARAGFESDMKALRDCEACVFVLPCGRSASFELGFAVGQGKRAIVLALEKTEPELMFADCEVLVSLAELEKACKVVHCARVEAAL